MSRTIRISTTMMIIVAVRKKTSKNVLKVARHRSHLTHWSIFYIIGVEPTPWDTSLYTGCDEYWIARSCFWKLYSFRQGIKSSEKIEINANGSNYEILEVFRFHTSFLCLDTGLGLCGWVLTIFSLLMFICTFPLSLFFTLKVSHFLYMKFWNIWSFKGNC